MKKVITVTIVLLFMLVGIVNAQSNPEIRNTTSNVYVYDAGDDITISKNQFIWIHQSTGYVDSDSGTSTNDIFCGISAVDAEYAAGTAAFKLTVWTFSVYMPLATYFNTDGANITGKAGAKVYWDYGTFVAPYFGVQTLDNTAAPVQIDYFKAWQAR
jgi:hypothetical protein